jgi:dihydrodipicolinate synthase/N-acetylneuraminate lyase
VPLFVGATALGTHDVVSRIRFAADRGVTGTLLGLPMWQPLTTSMAVRYYRDISEAFPDTDVMVYANARAFRYAFPVEFWEAVAKEAPTVVAAKVSKVDGLSANIEATSGRVHFLPNEMRVAQFYDTEPETTTACWATSASMGPRPVHRIIDAVAAGDRAEIERRSADIAWAHEPIEPILANPEVFASYNIQVEKARMEAAGYCSPGPVRPPYADMPEEYDAASRECGRRWRELCDR